MWIIFEIILKLIPPYPFLALIFWILAHWAAISPVLSERHVKIVHVPVCQEAFATQDAAPEDPMDRTPAIPDEEEDDLSVEVPPVPSSATMFWGFVKDLTCDDEITEGLQARMCRGAGRMHDRLTLIDETAAAEATRLANAALTPQSELAQDFQVQTFSRIRVEGDPCECLAAHALSQPKVRRDWLVWSATLKLGQREHVRGFYNLMMSSANDEEICRHYG